MSETDKDQAAMERRHRGEVAALRFILELFGSGVARDDDVDYCAPPDPDPDVTLEEELAGIKHDYDRSDDLDYHFGGDDLESHDNFCPHGADCNDVSCELVTYANVLAGMLVRAKCELAAIEAQQRHG